MRCSGRRSLNFSSRTKVGRFGTSFRVLLSFLRLPEKAFFANWRMSSGFLYPLCVSRWMTAESTFGCGSKCLASTLNA